MHINNLNEATARRQKTRYILQFKRSPSRDIQIAALYSINLFSHIRFSFLLLCVLDCDSLIFFNSFVPNLNYTIGSNYFFNFLLIDAIFLFAALHC